MLDAEFSTLHHEEAQAGMFNNTITCTKFHLEKQDTEAKLIAVIITNDKETI